MRAFAHVSLDHAAEPPLCKIACEFAFAKCRRDATVIYVNARVLLLGSHAEWDYVFMFFYALRVLGMFVIHVPCVCHLGSGVHGG